MTQRGWLLGDQPHPLGGRLEEIRATLKERDPKILAARTGAAWTIRGPSEGEFRFPFWSREVVLRFPSFEGHYIEGGEAINDFDLTMLAYYFEIADGTPVSGEWIGFNQIPGGMFYAQAFQGYTGNMLAKVFENDVAAFRAANETLGGRRQVFGDAAYEHGVLPSVPLLTVCWQGDDDFPPSYRMLFDANAHHQLTTDAYAILGAHLAKRLARER